MGTSPETCSRTCYDQIADIYDDDMGRNMRFADVSYYVERALENRGRILELGCGTGRVTLPLLRAGLTVTAVDISGRMLSALQENCKRTCTRSEQSRLQIAQMDVRQGGLRGKFSTILLPYSFFTYFVEPSEQRGLLSYIHRQICRDGHCVIDAFIPNPTIRYGEPIWDYTRSIADGRILQRWKMLERGLDPAVNLIRRHYRLLDRSFKILRTMSTVERIRCSTPKQMMTLLEENGYELLTIDWNYGSSAGSSDAQFATYRCRPLSPAAP